MSWIVSGVLAVVTSDINAIISSEKNTYSNYEDRKFNDFCTINCNTSKKS